MQEEREPPGPPPVRALLAIAVIAVAVVAAAAALGDDDRGRSGRGNSVAGLVRYASDSDPRFPDLAATARRNRYVILNFYERGTLRALKAANPDLKVLVYKNLAAISSSGRGPQHSSGVGYPEADAAHPDWFLTNTAGERFTFAGYDWLWVADIGNPAYQDAWAKNTIKELDAGGWDGVFMDDASYSIKYHYDPARVAKYPDDASYGTAMRAMIARVGPRIRAAGKLAFANLQLAEFPRPSRDWVRFLDGAMDEVFVKYGHTPGEGYSGPARWAGQLENLKALERQGKTLLAITQAGAGDVEAMRFGWATVLLGGDGHAAFELHQDGTHELVFPEYDYDLGGPDGDETTDPTGVHRRRFERGLVLVNPTTAAQHVDFGGTFTGSGLTARTESEMPPHTGLILTTADGR